VQKDFCNNIGTLQPKADQSECPQLVEADITHVGAARDSQGLCGGIL